MLLENTQSHSTMISWLSTSNTKLIQRGSPISLSVWSGHSWPGGHHHGTGRRSHHWGPGHHWHVASHRRPHSRSRSHWHHPRRRGTHHRHHGRAPHVRCRHHPRARRTRETGGRWDHCPCRRRSREWSRRYLSLLKCSSCFVNQALSLLFHPLLIVVFHILLVLPTTAVCLPHRWRIMGEVCVAVVTIKFRHVAPQAVSNSVPRRLEVTRSVSADAAEVTSPTRLQKSNPSHPILQLRCAGGNGVVGGARGGACPARLFTVSL